ncbi:MAG: HD domain-containing protein [Planctomycetes bacterium]|nr:HD domain-containing protein [Planctomycetota bacterium]
MSAISPTPQVRFADPARGGGGQRGAGRISGAGGRAYLVGGAVRDSLLGRDAGDADLEVYGLPPDQLEEVASEFGAVHVVGKQFAVLHLATEVGIIELALPRRESKTAPGHRGFSIEDLPDMDPAEAVLRRDFTVNAMLFDPLELQLYDFVGGRADLERGILRHVSQAFVEDPLRALRAARFVARYGWRIAPETSALCRQLDLSELPTERIEGEWQRMLTESAFPGKGLLAMEEVGALRDLPELRALRGTPQDPIWHPEGDVLHHTALALEAAAGIRSAMGDPYVEMLAVLCHDLGKATTTCFERGRWRSLAHDVEGEELTRSLLQRLSRRGDLADKVVPLVREHLRPAQLYFVRHEIKDSALRRLAARVDLKALVRVAWADSAGRAGLAQADWEPGKWLLERAEQIGVADSRPENFLRGRDAIDLGWSPGPAVGEVLAAAFELQLDGELADRDAALAWLGQQPRPRAR